MTNNFVGSTDILGVFGCDKNVAEAAWVCTDRVREAGDDEIKRVINFLAKEGHGTPFEHVIFRFMVTCPIFTARQWVRHRVGTYNERSLRYVKSKGDVYVPFDFSEQQKKLFEESVEKAFDAYEEIINIADDKRRARETARAVLPLGVFTKFEWTVNLRSLANFLRQRTDEHAQAEIRILAQGIENSLFELDDELGLEHSLKALKDVGWRI